MSESIFTKSVKAGAKTYFFDVKQAKAGKQSKFVQLTESRLHEGKWSRSTVTIFPDQLKAFVEAFQETVEQLS